MSYKNFESNNPCPICGSTSWCSYSIRNRVIFCRKESENAQSTHFDKKGVPFYVHKLSDERVLSQLSCDSSITNDEQKTEQDIKVNYWIYSKLLEESYLRKEHRDNLESRGLSSDEIYHRGYKSCIYESQLFNLKGGEGPSAKKIANVPGFSLNVEGKLVFKAPLGLIIPIRNIESKIVALKIRRDLNLDPKYLWVSSKKFGGASPGSPIHVPLHSNVTSLKTIRITEGELKADIATALSGILTLSIPGVSNWKNLFPVLEQIKPEKVILAMDKDLETNINVGDAVFRLFNLLRSKYKVEVESW